MMAFRKAARVDANQADIIKAARRLGATVTDTSRVGQGFPDIVVGIFGINLLIEIKDGDKPPSKRKLTDDQVVWHKAWNGSSYVINSADEMIALICSLAAKEPHV